MKTTRFLKIILFNLLLITGCQKEENPKPLPQTGYPYTYHILPQSEWEAANTDFQKINIYQGLSLNEYGFVQGEIPIIKNDSIKKDFVINTIDSLVKRYQSFMGIPPAINFNLQQDVLIYAFYIIPFGEISIDDFFTDLEHLTLNGLLEDSDIETIEYKFFLYQHRIVNELFSGPRLYFDFQQKKGLIKISGNWFPNAFIPDYEIYTKDDATVVAWQEILKNTGIDVWESKHNFTISKIFLNKFLNTKIEIRECWSVFTQVNEDLFCYVYIDTQTGEVVKYYARNWLYM